jgi:hypothetical protein
MNEWMKQRDLLIEETLAFAQTVSANAPKMAVMRVQPSQLAQAPASPLQHSVELAPHNKLDTERAAIQRRVANFKANQQQFQREREEYFQHTMAMARSDQWIPASRETRYKSASN